MNVAFTAHYEPKLLRGCACNGANIAIQQIVFLQPVFMFLYANFFIMRRESQNVTLNLNTAAAAVVSVTFFRIGSYNVYNHRCQHLLIIPESDPCQTFFNWKFYLVKKN